MHILNTITDNAHPAKLLQFKRDKSSLNEYNFFSNEMEKLTF